MQKYQVFISSVQVEFAKERKQLAEYFKSDPLLNQFFVPFIFEEVPANTHSPGKVYLGEVEKSAIYIGLLGANYGYEDEEGVSPTEREYDKAKAERLERWIYLRDTNQRHPKEVAFIRKIEQDVSRKKFSDYASLQMAVYHSCIRFLQQNGLVATTDFDCSLRTEAGIQDLDVDFLRRFAAVAKAKRNFPFRETDSPEQILTALKMLRGGRLVNSALLAFNSKPQWYFPAATIKCAHFHGTMVQKPIPDYKEFGGNVFEMADEAVDFILSKLSLSTGTREHSNLVDTVYEVPRAAIAEAVINAVAHRDYYSKGSIQVAVFSDRIEIFNPGTLPPELNIDDLHKPHGSYPHNPLLAECMFLYGAIERYGTGTLEIYHLSNEQGLKTPEFDLNEGFKVTIWRPATITDHVTDHVTDYVTDPRIIDTPIGRLVFALIGEMSRQQLMDRLELRHSPNFRDNYLDPAFNEGLIEMTIPDKPKSINQKYRLTAKGIELRNRLHNRIL